MRIAFASEPRGGRDFEFEVADAGADAHVQLYIGDNLVMEARCPDPPCHERVFVPLEAVGNMLRVRAQDVQEASEHVFAIGPQKAESDPASSAETD
jgi:hypothetical protein